MLADGTKVASVTCEWGSVFFFESSERLIRCKSFFWPLKNTAKLQQQATKEDKNNNYGFIDRRLFEGNFTKRKSTSFIRKEERVDLCRRLWGSNSHQMGPSAEGLKGVKFPTMLISMQHTANRF